MIPNATQLALYQIAQQLNEPQAQGAYAGTVSEQVPKGQVPTEEKPEPGFLDLLKKRALLFGLLGGGLALAGTLIEGRPGLMTGALIKNLPLGLLLGALTGVGIGTLEHQYRLYHAINTGQFDRYNLPLTLQQQINQAEQTEE